MIPETNSAKTQSTLEHSTPMCEIFFFYSIYVLSNNLAELPGSYTKKEEDEEVEEERKKIKEEEERDKKEG